MNIRNKIEEEFHNILEQTDSSLNVSSLKDDVVLLESGLDSLGFAILVATLEDTLGFDPFLAMDEPYYPTTFGEFVKLYEEYYQKQAINS